jgi:hypothetical protein
MRSAAVAHGTQQVNPDSVVKIFRANHCSEKFLIKRARPHGPLHELNTDAYSARMNPANGSFMERQDRRMARVATPRSGVTEPA